MNMPSPTLQDIIGDTSWFPDNVNLERGTFGFVHTDRTTLSQQSFLDGRWDRNALPHVDIPISAILPAIGETTPQANFIWHTAFCCSTLIARCLDVEGTNLSLKEPQILIQLAEAKRAGHLAKHSNVADAILKLLARHSARERVLIKPTNAVNNLVPEAVGLTNGRMLFLYSDCKSFLLSIAKKGEMGRIFARKLFALFAADGHAQAKWPWQTLFELSDLQIAALVWHMQIAEFRRSRDTARSAALNCDDFLSRPRETLERLNAFFDLHLSASQLDAVISGPLLAQNAKDTSETFSAERRVAEASSIAKTLGSELDTVIEWSYRACPETPRENPLGPTL